MPPAGTGAAADPSGPLRAARCRRTPRRTDRPRPAGPPNGAAHPRAVPRRTVAGAAPAAWRRLRERNNAHSSSGDRAPAHRKSMPTTAMSCDVARGHRRRNRHATETTRSGPRCRASASLHDVRDDRTHRPMLEQQGVGQPRERLHQGDGDLDDAERGAAECLETIRGAHVVWRQVQALRERLQDDGLDLLGRRVARRPAAAPSRPDRRWRRLSLLARTARSPSDRSGSRAGADASRSRRPERSPSSTLARRRRQSPRVRRRRAGTRGRRAWPPAPRSP